MAVPSGTRWGLLLADLDPAPLCRSPKPDRYPEPTQLAHHPDPPWRWCCYRADLLVGIAIASADRLVGLALRDRTSWWRFADSDNGFPRRSRLKQRATQIVRSLYRSSLGSFLVARAAKITGIWHRFGSGVGRVPVAGVFPGMDVESFQFYGWY